MITIFAEKPDVGMKIAAALDKITLNSGKVVNFSDLKSYEKQIKAQQRKDGYLRINYNGDDCYVTWGFGHLCCLKQAKDYDDSYKNWKNLPVPFIPSKYEIKASEGSTEQLKIIKGLFNSSSLIINATDDDREGEVIFAYVYQLLNCKVPYKRSHFSSQTKEGIINGIKTLKSPSDVKNTELAGRARDIADSLIGWNITARLTLKFSYGKNVLSAGRCQTAVTNILVKREKEIRNFKSKDYYTIDTLFTTSKNESYKAEHTSKRFDNKADADAILTKISGHKGIITNIDKKIIEKKNPNLYSLNALQMDANEKYGLPLDETLKIAQRLYDNGFTTYPRTDSQYLNEDMEPVINQILNELETIPEYKSLISGRPRTIERGLFFDNSRVSSHFAIIPTTMKPSGLKPDEQKVYDLIARSVIKMIYPYAKLEKTKVTTTVNGENFITDGTSINYPGWMIVGDCSKEAIIPSLTKNETVDGKFELKAKKTEPPKRYTDKTLLAAMMSAGKTLDDATLKKFMADNKIEGIGRESTRAEIVKKVIERGYAERKGKSIAATDKGIELIDIIPFEEIKSAELTAKWETRLSNIEKGTEDFNIFVKDIEKLTKEWCEKIDNSKSTITHLSSGGAGTSGTSTTKYLCPVCKSPISKYDWGYGCSAYKTGCKFSIGKIAGKTLTDKQFEQLLNSGKTDIIKGFKGKKGTFDAHLLLKVDKTANTSEISFEFPDNTSKFTCPKCGKALSKMAWGYGCSGYKDGCKFSIGKIAGKTITENQITKLLNDKETDIIKGFTGKNGKFDAKLKLVDNEIKFEFSNK